MSINRYVCTGNLTRDAEVRNTSSGMAIVSFGIAVDDRRKNGQTGQWEDVPNFLDVSCFGDRYEKLAKYLLKGKKVAIEGKLRYSSWTDKSGNKRSKIEVIPDDIELLGGREDSGKSYGGGQPQQVQAEVIDTTGGVYDDDCPF